MDRSFQNQMPCFTALGARSHNLWKDIGWKLPYFMKRNFPSVLFFASYSLPFDWNDLFNSIWNRILKLECNGDVTCSKIEDSDWLSDAAFYLIGIKKVLCFRKIIPETFYKTCCPRVSDHVHYFRCYYNNNKVYCKLQSIVLLVPI